MKLSEKMARKRAMKEQRQAEKQLKKAGKTGTQIVSALRKDKDPIDLKEILTVAELFDPSQKSEVIEALLDKPQHKAMYAVVRDELEGDWMSDFKSLLAAVPADRAMQAQVNRWEDWQVYGKKASLDEKGLTQALQVILVFRKAMDPNKLRKPGQK